ncbi:MAG TPA: HlyD family efflux transporter periplasmic adaptor subunit [Vicinamibacterales bacterium]
MSRRIVFGIAAVAVAGALAAAGITTASSLTAPSDTTPTARAVSGSLSLDVTTVGELRATRMTPVSAPPVGGQLRILSIVSTGQRVAPGDIIVEFDPIDQQFALQSALSQLEEAEQEIVRLKANAAVTAAQMRVDLMTARFDVRRAELDIRGDADLIAANERRKRELTLEEARRRLAQLEADEKSRALTSAAQMAVLQERLNKERSDAERARRNIDSLVVKAQMPGLVVVRENRDASGGIFFSGMTLPEFKAGDTTGAGRPILDVFDISGIEVRTAIDEHQRDNVVAGQEATVTFEAFPGLESAGTVVSVSNQAMRSMRGPSPIRQFDAAVRLAEVDDRLRPGTSVRVQLKGRTVDNVVYVPRTAIFEHDGKPVVYVRPPGETRFVATPVKVTHRTEAHTAVEGIDAGTEVSLVNPEKKPGGAAAPAANGARAGGPR